MVVNMHKLAVLVAVLFLGGCAYSERIRAVESAVVEPAVDQAVDSALDRLCKLPPDIVMRGIDRRGEAMAEALYLVCPDYRALINLGIGVISRRNALGLAE